ncbi:hypothetical protein COV11_01810 [Candidatus Woesearchaeota archaeon CG10_big_fil_rev_8_21_14_0_10_30_7]|nr:MAG: hypothetical protein COV11_01810 [Candidatus Woesearchaeota archaeon CG10_big_fil_rev_8_21_14_0_10_30_7]
MDTTILEDLGLSKGEIKTYITLLELGTTKVGNIIKKSEMASSAVHNAINSLINKGLTSYIKKGKIKHYQAVSPKQLLDFIEEKKKKLTKILPELEIKQQITEKQEAEIFEGTKGIITMLNKLIENTKKGDKYYFFATHLQNKNEEIQKFFKKFDTKRKEKKLNVKGIAPTKIKKLFKGRKILKMKFVNFPIPSDISICKNKTALIAWSEKPIGYLINSKQISQMYKEYFEKTWKQTTLDTHKTI